MSHDPPKRNLPRKLSGAMGLRPHRFGRIGADAHDPSDSAEAGITRSQDRAGRRERTPERYPDSDASYEVGYRRPPKHTQFKPGKSGNPKGRSPQSRNLKTIVKQVLDEQVSIREGGRARRMATIEALVRITVSRAFKGDSKALTLLIVMMKQTGYGTEAVENALEFLQGLDHEGIIAEFLARAALDGFTTARSSNDPTEASAPSGRGKT